MTPHDLSMAAYGLHLAGEYKKADEYVTQAIRLVWNKGQLREPGDTEQYISLYHQRATIRLDSVGHYQTTRDSRWAARAGYGDAIHAYAFTLGAWNDIDREQAPQMLTRARQLVERANDIFEQADEIGHERLYPASWLDDEGNLSPDIFPGAQSPPLSVADSETEPQTRVIVGPQPEGTISISGLGHVIGPVPAAEPSTS